MKVIKSKTSKRKIILSVVITIIVVSGLGAGIWYVLPEKVTVYVSYPYQINGTFKIVIDNQVLANETNYSFNFLPPYTVGYEKSLQKGAHIISVFDGTYNHTSHERFNLWKKLYITVSINENGVRFIIQDKEPKFL